MEFLSMMLFWVLLLACIVATVAVVLFIFIAIDIIRDYI